MSLFFISDYPIRPTLIFQGASVSLTLTQRGNRSGCKSSCKLQPTRRGYNQNSFGWKEQECDAAIECGVECGGRLPKSRIAEDGVVPAEYTAMVEMTRGGDY
ncbi:YpsA SLOG family protein [Desulfocicer niacini]